MSWIISACLSFYLFLFLVALSTKLQATNIDKPNPNIGTTMIPCEDTHTAATGREMTTPLRFCGPFESHLDYSCRLTDGRGTSVVATSVLPEFPESGCRTCVFRNIGNCSMWVQEGLVQQLVGCQVYPKNQNPPGNVEFVEKKEFLVFPVTVYQQPLVKEVVPREVEAGDEVWIRGHGFFSHANHTRIHLFNRYYNISLSVTPSSVERNRVAFKIPPLLFEHTHVIPPINPEPDPLFWLRENGWVVIVGINALLITCIAVGVFFYLQYHRKKSGYKLLEVEDFQNVIISPNDIQMKELTGHGAFSAVYRGRWRGIDVAVKKLNAKTDAVLERNFLKEATILRRLHHPNIVAFLGLCIQKPNLSIITEFMPRGSLRQILLDSSIILEEEHRRRFAVDVCQGMAYLHSENIIHRDLKASNLLVDKEWTIKVADFGLSREGEETDVTMTMTACGTPAWAAPEVLQTQRYSEKADVYSFAICLWELCTRQIPYEGIPPYQIVISVATQGRRPDLTPHDVSTNFKKLMRMCWDDDSMKRPTFTSLIQSFLEMECPVPEYPHPFTKVKGDREHTFSIGGSIIV